MKRSKRFTKASEKFDRGTMYHPYEAAKIMKENANAKFDETFEVAIRLGVDPRKADQMVRGTLVLPRGTGKERRVVVFAQGEKASEAEEAGADVVGAEDLAERVEGGWADFDVAIATPDLMSMVGKLGRILGPRGLMPNPKSGTVTFDIAKAVKDAKGGKIEYRVDKQANVHLSIGKTSFSLQELLENYAAVLEEILRSRPPVAKGRYIKSITFSSTMGPGVRVDPLVTRNFMPEEVAAPEQL